MEMQGNLNLQHDVDHLAYGGTVVVIGNQGMSTVEFNPRTLMNKNPYHHES